MNPSCCLLLEQMPEGLEASTFQMSMVFEDNQPCTRKLLDGAVALGFMVYLMNLQWVEQCRHALQASCLWGREVISQNTWLADGPSLTFYAG